MASKKRRRRHSEVKYPVSIYDLDKAGPKEYRAVTYPGVKKNMYLVSNYGDVYSKHSNRHLTPFQEKDGHLGIKLVPENSGKYSKCCKIHRLVAHEFLEPDPRENATLVNHKNGKPYCNFAANLEYCTEQENKRHAAEHGLMARGEQSGTNKFSESLVRKICELFEQGMSPTEVRNELGIKRYDDDKSLSNLIGNIYRKECWIHVSKEYNF